jgi:hypothetical protein
MIAAFPYRHARIHEKVLVKADVSSFVLLQKQQQTHFHFLSFFRGCVAGGLCESDEENVRMHTWKACGEWRCRTTHS